MEKFDLLKFTLKHEDSLSKIELEVYLLDLLRMMQIIKKGGNSYYYRLFRKFVTAVLLEKRLNIDVFDRDLPRIYLKEKEVWELQEMLLNKP